MSGPVLALNLFMAGLSVYFSIRVGHALFTPELQSPSRIARPFVVTAPRNHDVAPNSRPRGVYDVIATRTLFHPNRSEPTRSEAITQIMPSAPTLALYGVVITGDTRLAYSGSRHEANRGLQDRGQTGWRTGERIEPDRVVIMRAEGPFEVMLHDQRSCGHPHAPPPVVPLAGYRLWEG